MTSPGTVQPTDAEITQAATLLVCWQDTGEPYSRLGKMIALALADQRARYEALADELDRDAAQDEDEGWAAGQRYSAGRLRAVLAAALDGGR